MPWQAGFLANACQDQFAPGPEASRKAAIGSFDAEPLSSDLAQWPSLNRGHAERLGIAPQDRSLGDAALHVELHP